MDNRIAEDLVRRLRDRARRATSLCASDDQEHGRAVAAALEIVAEEIEAATILTVRIGG